MTETASYIDTLKELQACLFDEDLFEKALSLCDQLLTRDDVPPTTLVATLHETRLKLLLHLERFQELLESENVPSSLESYVKYRLHQYETSSAMTAENNESDVLSRHVLAQSLYRLHQESALDIYKNLLSLVNDEEEILQIKTNYMAVLAAHAVPFCSPAHMNVDEAFLEPSDESNSDYLYNRATYHLLTGINSRSMLKEARRVCQDDDEAAAIDVQLQEWSLVWNGLAPEEKMDTNDLPQAVKAVVDVNRTKSVSSLAPKCPSNWTALQQRLYVYKRAILQLQARQYKECAETCQLLHKSLAQHKNNAPPPVNNKEQEAWWKSRISVVEAHALFQQGKTPQALDLLSKLLKSLESMDSTPVIDHAVAYTMLHLNELENGGEWSAQKTVDMLLRLPTSIRSSKAVTSTLVTLYQELGQVERATELLQNQEGGMADYYMSTGNYQEAARLLESAPGKEAEMVVALSYVDPIKARQIWNDIRDENGGTPEELNGEELENMDLPRFKSKKTVLVPTSKEVKEKRSNESILRRRARKREEYLKNHPNAKKLDPERWLPKHERSYYRKRRGRDARGAQGGGASNKDADKLDVAARASGQAMDTGPSTAHIDVSSGSGKRSGRRR